MKLAIVSGSTRNRSTSNKVAESILQLASNSTYFSQISLIDFSKLSLPIWDSGLKKEFSLWQSEWESTADAMRTADAVIIISPEWEEESLDNFYTFSRYTQIPAIPCIVLRISSDCRGAYSAVDLAMNNFAQNSTYLILEHLIVTTSNAVNSCKENSYPLEGKVIERILTSFSLINQLVIHGGIDPMMQLQAG